MQFRSLMILSKFQMSKSSKKISYQGKLVKISLYNKKKQSTLLIKDKKTISTQKKKMTAFHI